MLALDPSNTRAYNELARVATYARADGRAAVEPLRQIAKLRPDSFEAHAQLGKRIAYLALDGDPSVSLAESEAVFQDVSAARRTTRRHRRSHRRPRTPLRPSRRSRRRR